MTIREAEAEVRRMRRWKKKASKGYRADAAAALKRAVTQALIESGRKYAENHARLMASAARFGSGKGRRSACE